MNFLAAASLLLLAAAPSAVAEPPTRDAYVAQLESVCQPRSEASERASRGLKQDIKRERLKVAARKFVAVRRIFAATVDRIAPIPRPAADREKLAEWFGYLGRQERYLEKITADLHAGRTIASQHHTARFVHNGRLANRTVLAFGFEYCSFDFARFG